MQFKIPNEQGITLIEILVVTLITGALTVVLFAAFNPIQSRARARDQKRLTDIATLDRVINEFNVDNGSYPDSVNTLRRSNQLPVGNVGPYENVTNGWIKAALSTYTPKIPTDPINDATYFYSYFQNGHSYELNAKLEYYTDQLTSDGGNSSTIYELGNNLTLL